MAVQLRRAELEKLIAEQQTILLTGKAVPSERKFQPSSEKKNEKSKSANSVVNTPEHRPLDPEILKDMKKEATKKQNVLHDVQNEETNAKERKPTNNIAPPRPKTRPPIMQKPEKSESSADTIQHEPPSLQQNSVPNHDSEGEEEEKETQVAPVPIVVSKQIFVVYKKIPPAVERKKSVTYPPSGKKITKLFKVPLFEILQHEENNAGVPLIVMRCAEYISIYLETEGLFRVSPNFSDFNGVVDWLDKGNEIAFKEGTDVHIVCGVLKKFLRELPQPVLTFEMYTCFIAVYGILEKYPQFSVEEILLPKISNIFAMMPSANKQVSKYLLDFLGRVSALSEKNKMGISNLATIFGPLLLRTSETDTTNMDLLSDASMVINVVQTLITHRDKIL